MTHSSKTILVTGASRGLGLAITDRLAQEGYRVIATARNQSDDLKKLTEEIRKSGGEVRFYPFDLTHTKDIHEFIKTITNAHGHLYGLVNNAALGLGGILATMHDSEIQDLVHINLLSTIFMIKYASRSMLLNKQGRIINISSIASDTGYKGLSVYAATKAALTGLTKSLSRELGQTNITINNVAPGYMETDMTKGIDSEDLEAIKRRSPMRKLVDVNEVPGAVLFLLGDDARSITGTTITVDAGSSA